MVVCAAGGLPGELHKLWRASNPKGYHVEYGYSCMGYEIAGGLGAKMALPDREIFVLVGDGSYLMLNSEIATSVLLQQKIVIVVLDNGGFGCINRLQQACGGEPFNNLLDDSQPGQVARTPVDFAANAQALGAISENVRGLAELGQALERAKSAEKTYVIALATSPDIATAQGGAWWMWPCRRLPRARTWRERTTAIESRSRLRNVCELTNERGMTQRLRDSRSC